MVLIDAIFFDNLLHSLFMKLDFDWNSCSGSGPMSAFPNYMWRQVLFASIFRLKHVPKSFFHPSTLIEKVEIIIDRLCVALAPMLYGQV